MEACGVLASHFCRKKAVCSSCLVLGCVEPRPHWVQKGRGLDVLSRLKGIETSKSKSASSTLSRGLDVLSRLKGIETYQYQQKQKLLLLLVWMCFPV